MRITATLLALALTALVGCGNETPVGPSSEEFAQARQELASKIQKGAPAKKVARRAPAQQQVEQAAFTGDARDVHYDSKGKRDPFRSYTWEQIKLEGFDVDARGPLEQFDVAQLTLLGVVWDARRARALVQDPSGMSYIIAEGTKIGKNKGLVISINDNLVVVKETYEDFMGEKTTKDVEMRIRATEGG